MNLHIIAIGRKKSEYDDIVHEYQKRIVAPFSLVIEVVDELEKVPSKLKPSDYIIAMDELGRDFTTIEFSKLIEKQLSAAPKRIVFVIGGSYGLDDATRKSANLIMRLGAITLPHELARLVLVEQLYRVTNVIGGGKYHH